MLRTWFLGLFLPLSLMAGDWSLPVKPQHTSGLQFRWRAVHSSAAEQLHALEWEFYNSSDSSLNFTYRIGTNHREQTTEEVTGRAILAGHERKIAGWKTVGDTVVSVSVDTIGSEQTQGSNGRQ